MTAVEVEVTIACGFGTVDGLPCPKPPVGYGGYDGANDWACFVCEDHEHVPGFRIWDRLKEVNDAEVPDEAR